MDFGIDHIALELGLKLLSENSKIVPFAKKTLKYSGKVRFMMVYKFFLPKMI